VVLGPDSVAGKYGEQGIALPMALGFMMVLSVSLVTVLELSTSAQRAAGRSQAKEKAQAVAEAGLNQAVSVLAEAPDPASSSALPIASAPGTVAIEGGTASYWGSLDTAPNPDVWIVTSVASVGNPTGGAPITHTVTAQYQIASGGSMAGNEAWNYVYSDNTTSCTYLQNGVTVTAPIYTRGDFCVKNNSHATGPRVDVRGSITVDDSASVGTNPADASDPAVTTGAGCRYTTSPVPSHANCTAASQVYRSSYSSGVPDYAKPTLDLFYWRGNAKPGPLHPCTSSSGPVPSFISTGLINLMPTSSYTCTVTESGTVVGELSWNNSTKVLTVNGVAYFDGELVMDNDNQGTYSGKGTIYVAGKIAMRNQTWLCAMSSCAASGWNPNTRLLTLVSGSPALPAFELNNFAKFQGAAYAAGAFRIQNNATIHGPVIAATIEALNSGFVGPWTSLTSLTPGMPGYESSTATVAYVPGSWRG
jgi:Tfp pilus assembly protein PilX